MDRLCRVCRSPAETINLADPWEAEYAELYGGEDVESGEDRGEGQVLPLMVDRHERRVVALEQLGVLIWGVVEFAVGHPWIASLILVLGGLIWKMFEDR